MKKNIVLFVCALMVTATSQASTQQVECVSATKAGKILKLSFCQNESNDLIACQNEESGLVTVRRETSTLKGTVIESIQIPTDYFYLTREEELTRLELASDMGSLQLSYVGGEMPGGRWNVKIGSFDHSFNAVRCDFK